MKRTESQKIKTFKREFIKRLKAHNGRWDNLVDHLEDTESLPVYDYYEVGKAFQTLLEVAAVMDKVIKLTKRHSEKRKP